MKVRYEFVTGIVEIEVEDAWGEVVVDMDRREFNNNHRETRRHVSMELLAEQMGGPLADPGMVALVTPPAFVMALESLDVEQQELLQAIAMEGLSQKEYALRKGLHPSTVGRQMQVLLEKLCKLLG